MNYSKTHEVFKLTIRKKDKEAVDKFFGQREPEGFILYTFPVEGNSLVNENKKQGICTFFVTIPNHRMVEVINFIKQLESLA